jgi:hypothetical protein
MTSIPLCVPDFSLPAVCATRTSFSRPEVVHGPTMAAYAPIPVIDSLISEPDIVSEKSNIIPPALETGATNTISGTSSLTQSSTAAGLYPLSLNQPSASRRPSPEVASHPPAVPGQKRKRAVKMVRILYMLLARMTNRDTGYPATTISPDLKLRLGPIRSFQGGQSATRPVRR